MEISKKFGCSHGKIVYWMRRYNISRRPRRDAMYVKYNPNGDPFKIKKNLTRDEAELKGLGVGLYWGEGTKADKCSVKIGNTDPVLIKKFIEFLIRICGVKKPDLKFGLQIFSDMDPQEVLKFWTNKLRVKSDRFYKIIITPARSLGTYRNKSKYGVLTIYYHNRKLRDILCELTMPG